MDKLSSLLIFLASFVLAVWLGAGQLEKAHSQGGASPPPPPSVPAADAIGAGASPQAPPSTLVMPPALAPVPSEVLPPSGEGFRYDPTGRRDPFRPYGSDLEKSNIPGGVIVDTDMAGHGEMTELQNFEITQLKLVAVSWGTRKPIAVVKDPTGKHHVVKKYTRIGRGNGFVAVIREGEVVVVEPAIIDGNSTAITKVLVLNK